jgi:hypothetical protein
LALFWLNLKIKGGVIQWWNWRQWFSDAQEKGRIF